MTDKSAPYTLETARQAIAALNDERIAQLNRILATEALLKAIISELPEETLRQLEETYDLRVIHAMGHLPPTHQRPHLWQPYLDKIQEVIALRTKQRGHPPR